MAERTNPQAEIIVGARDDASPSFEAIKRNAQKMGEAVERSAKKAGDSVGKIGDNAAPSAAKVERATRNIISAIERVTASSKAGGRDSPDFFVERAKQLGVSADRIKPYVDELRRAQDAQRIAAGSLDKMGLSAKQTTAALRQVPMQFTDIIVSLQGGQKPMQVLLQQGGQLKDIFGGIGPAAQALGGYVLGLVNPLTLTAAALSAIGVAYYQGSKESDAYAKSLLLTGNAAGTTASQMQQMAANVSSAIGTQAAAADALAQMAGTGRVAADDLQGFTETALRMERDVGVAVKDTVSAFAELGKSPVEASKKLNDQHNYLTASIYSQIKALEQQGNATGAAQLAQETYDKAMQRVAAGMQERLGYLEKAWRGVGSAAKWAWDQVANVGRPDTLSDQIANVQQKILQGQGLDKNRPGGLMPWEPSLNDYKAQLADLQERQRMEEKLARTTSERAAANKAATEAMDAVDKLTESAASKQEKLNKALEDYRRSLEKIRAVDPNDKRLDPSAVAKVEANIRDQYKDKSVKTSSGQNELDSIRAKIALEDEYIARLKQQGTSAEKANEGERLAAKLNQELAGTLDAKTRAQKEGLLVAANTLAARQSERSEIEQQAKAADEAEKSYRKYIDGLQKTSDSIGQQADQQEAANAAYGKSKTAIAELTLAQMKLRLETEKNAGPWDATAVAAMKDAVSQQERLVKSLHDADYNKATDSLKESIALSGDQLALTKQDLSLLGLSDLERKKIVATRKIEIDLAKKLREIEKQTYSSNADENAARKEELRQQARKDASIKTEEAIAQVTLDEWQKTADQINQSLTDALLRGFESGKDFAKNMRDTVVNMFKTMVLKPVIQMVLNPISMGLAGILGGGSAMAGQGGAGSLLGLASNASSAYNLATGGFGSMVFGNAAAYSAMTPGLTLGSQQAAMLAAQTGKFGLAGATATAQAGGAGLGGFGGLLSSPLGIAAVGAGLAAAFGLFRKTVKRGDVLTGTLGVDDGIRSGDLMRKDGFLFGGPDWFLNDTGVSGLDKAIQAQWSASLKTVEEWSKALGLSTDKIEGFTTTLGTEKLGDHGAIGIRLDKDGTPLSDQEIQAKIAEAIRSGNNELAQQLIGTWETATTTITRTILNPDWQTLGWDSGEPQYKQVTETVTTRAYAASQFAREGEQAIDTLQRLATSLLAANTAFKHIGQTAYEGSLAGADLASQLVDQFGTLDQFTASTGNFYKTFIPEQKQYQDQLEAVRGEFDKLNTAMPLSRQQFVDLVNSLDLTTESGRETFAALMGVSDAFAQLTLDLSGAMSNLATMISSQMLGTFEGQNPGAALAQVTADGIYNAIAGGFSQQISAIIVQGVVEPVVMAAMTGSSMSAAVSQASIDAMVAQAQAAANAASQIMNDPAFQSALKDIEAAVGSISIPKAAQDAARAAEQVAGAWRKLGDTMMDEVDRIRGVVADDSGQGMAYWQSKFAIDTAAARAGDQDAAGRLSGISRELLGAAEKEASSALELQRIRNVTAANLQQSAATFYDRDGDSAHAKELAAEVKQLREDNRAQAVAMAELQSQLLRLFKRWDVDGMPEQRQEVA